MLFAQETWGMAHLAQMRVSRKFLLKQHLALILRANGKWFKMTSAKMPFPSFNVRDAVLIC